MRARVFVCASVCMRVIKYDYIIVYYFIYLYILYTYIIEYV